MMATAVWNEVGMVTIAVESLCSCCGCEAALLNTGEPLLEILPELTFVHMPLLADRTAPMGRASPRAAVGIVVGAVRRSGHLKRLLAFRRQVDVLVAMGTCAGTGGLPGLGNLPGVDLDAVARPVCTVPGPEADPDDELLPVCSAVGDHVYVDLELPGCPPNPDWLGECILSFLDMRAPLLPGACLCDTCPAHRSGSRPLDDMLFRMLDQPDTPPRNDPADMPCLLEQGFMCMGPVTRAGCGGRSGRPQCVSACIPCRGCHGPAQQHPQPLADYVAALAAAGYDPRTMPDKPGFLSRFTGARIMANYREKP